jgi:hypothetical protein
MRFIGVKQKFLILPEPSSDVFEHSKPSVIKLFLPEHRFFADCLKVIPFLYNYSMKTITLLFTLLFLANCAVPSNPKLSFGKKCHVDGDNITYSYVWLFDKEMGLKASEAQCIHLPEKSN